MKQAHKCTKLRLAILSDTLQEGIYFIGFDQSHVGYIQKKNDELFVIHSNYIGSEGVVIERINDSRVFSYYTRIYIADISRNTALMKKWVKGEVIQILTEWMLIIPFAKIPLHTHKLKQA